MTVRSPSQEWRLYIFGIGSTFRLWKSNTAMSAITLRMKTKIIIAAWASFNFNFGSFRNMRYIRIPEIYLQKIFSFWNMIRIHNYLSYHFHKDISFQNSWEMDANWIGELDYFAKQNLLNNDLPIYLLRQQ